LSKHPYRKKIHRGRLKEKHRTRKYHVLYHISYSPTTPEAALPYIAGFQQAIANTTIVTYHKKMHRISFPSNVMKITQKPEMQQNAKDYRLIHSQELNERRSYNHTVFNQQKQGGK